MAKPRLENINGYFEEIDLSRIHASLSLKMKAGSIC